MPLAPAMKLSVIIVNYNVKYFLEQCLLSVNRACRNIESEIFVVDNASSDGSVEMLKEKFPSVKMIGNTNNVGFAKANNQAIEKSSGEFVLLLNPDTVVAEDTFEKCIAFMQTHSATGALGVRMIDGKGNFLPESKRGLPTPAVAFYKTFGLAKLFPRSKTFGKYHLGFLNEHETNEVEVLSGAFMFIRKSVLDTIGLLDESFFMYGEDIDFSYRITTEGFKNFYFPETTIIHYKGESTRRTSLNYVVVFYNAMKIFAEKHFTGNQSGIFSALINAAIVLRGLLTLLANLFASSYMFIIDALLAYAGIFFITDYWEKMIKYKEHYYPEQFLFGVVPAYVLIWVVSAFFGGAYDKPFRISTILRGIIFGTIFIAVLYAFLPNDLRFSRAIILLGAVWTALEMILTRSLYHLIKHQTFSAEEENEKRSLVVGRNGEAVRAESILRALGTSQEIKIQSEISVVKKSAAIFGSNEVVFCSKDFLFREIIHQISQGDETTDYKILNEGSDALIGSNSKNTAGDLYVAEKNYSLFQSKNMRNKRVFDLSVCGFLLLLLPLNIFLIKNFGKFFSNWVSVLTGEKWWVGFLSEGNLKKFISAKHGVLHPSGGLNGFTFSAKEQEDIELSYAQHYSVRDDWRIFWMNYKNLGQ